MGGQRIVGQQHSGPYIYSNLYLDIATLDNLRRPPIYRPKTPTSIAQSVELWHNCLSTEFTSKLARDEINTDRFYALGMKASRDDMNLL